MLCHHCFQCPPAIHCFESVGRCAELENKHTAFVSCQHVKLGCPSIIVNGNFMCMCLIHHHSYLESWMSSMLIRQHTHSESAGVGTRTYCLHIHALHRTKSGSSSALRADGLLMCPSCLLACRLRDGRSHTHTHTHLTSDERKRCGLQLLQLMVVSVSRCCHVGVEIGIGDCMAPAAVAVAGACMLAAVF